MLLIRFDLFCLARELSINGTNQLYPWSKPTYVDLNICLPDDLVKPGSGVDFLTTC